MTSSFKSDFYPRYCILGRKASFKGGIPYVNFINGSVNIDDHINIGGISAS